MNDSSDYNIKNHEKIIRNSSNNLIKKTSLSQNINETLDSSTNGYVTCFILKKFFGFCIKNHKKPMKNIEQV